jgi:hypothetical protein
MSALAVAGYRVLRLLVPAQGDARISYTDLVSQLPVPFCRLDMAIILDRNTLSAALKEIVPACKDNEPPLPPLPAIVVRIFNGQLEYSGGRLLRGDSSGCGRRTRATCPLGP